MFITLGLAASLMGPSLTDLRERVGVSTGAIGVLFPCSSIGYVAGAVLGGKGYDRRLGHRLVMASLVLTALAMVVVAWAPSLLWLGVGSVLVGFFSSGVDLGGNTLLVWSRGRDAGPLLNALHLCFGIGAFLAPLFVNRALAWGHGVGWAWVAAAIPTMVVAAWVITRATPEPVDVEGHDRGETAPSWLLALLMVFFVLYVGLEIGFAGWVYTYAQEIHLGGPNVPALLTATFWGSFSVGRLTSVWLARRVGPNTLLSGSCVQALGAIALLAAGHRVSAIVWISTVLFGFGTAPQFPTMIAFAERHIPLTGSATSWFIVGAGLGGLSMPWLIGTLLDRWGAVAMPRAVLVIAAGTLAWYLLVHHMLVTRTAGHGERAVAAPASGLPDPPLG